MKTQTGSLLMAAGMLCFAATAIGQTALDKIATPVSAKKVTPVGSYYDGATNTDNGATNAGCDDCDSQCDGRLACDGRTACDGLGLFNGCRNGGLHAGLEFTFLKYGQEGGVSDVFGNPARFDYEVAPRFWLGWDDGCGFGLRTRYWDSDNNVAESTTGDLIGVDAYTVDIEAYQNYSLARHSDLELSVGARYLDYHQYLTANAANAEVFTDSQGFGLTAGLEWTRNLGRGNLYAKARGTVGQGSSSLNIAIAGGPATVVDADDNSLAQTEFGLGYEICRQTRWGTLVMRTGFEAQQWANVAPASTNFGGGLTTFGDVMEDANFSGFVFGGELRR